MEDNDTRASHQPHMHCCFPGLPGYCENKCHGIGRVYSSTKMASGLEWMWMDTSPMVLNAKGKRVNHILSEHQILHLSLLQSSKHSVSLFHYINLIKFFFLWAFGDQRSYFSVFCYEWGYLISVFYNGHKYLFHCWF